MRSTSRAQQDPNNFSPASVRPYQSPLTRWVWAVFIVNAAVALIFAALCGSTYQGFLDVIEQFKQQGAAAPININNWLRLFRGAAISAAFAFVLTIIFHVLAVVLLLCSFRSLAHPGRKFGRAFIIAASWWTSLHILNITLQFHMFEPTMATWRSDYQANFNLSKLRACVGFGYMSCLLYALYGTLVLFWRGHPELLMVERPPEGAEA